MSAASFLRCSRPLPILHRGLFSVRRSSSSTPFAGVSGGMQSTKLNYFQIDEPRLGNQYDGDLALKSFVKHTFPENIAKEIEADLHRFGDVVVKETWPLAKECELHPPTHTPYNAYGSRVDHIWTHPHWAKDLPAMSAREGLISIGYERDRWGAFARLYQSAKLYLFGQFSCIYTCPLAMTDGAARMIEHVASAKDYTTTHSQQLRDELQQVFNHLTSRDPKEFWTSGQWMTERTGGSDVSNSETLAVHNPNRSDDRSYLLHGYKFFTSAITADVSFGLARTATNVDGQGAVSGSKGLSVFLIYPNKADGTPNNIIVHRLKNKFGTKAVPPAELELLGTPAELVGEKGRGVATISALFNVTRVHNAVSSVSGMRRAVAVARDYAHRRQAFGKKLADHALHTSVLGKLETETRACLLFLLDSALVHGRAEFGGPEAKSDMNLLRIITPLLKMYTAKRAIEVTSEALECLGGQGYMEDSWMPMLIRDIQVTSIWEGTTNVQSLDVLRALSTHPDAFGIFERTIKTNVKIGLDSKDSEINAAAQAVQSAWKATLTALADLQKSGAETAAAFARELADGLSRVYIASLFFRLANVDHLWKASCLEYIQLNDLANSRWTSLVGSRRPGASERLRTLGLALDEQGKPTGCGNEGRSKL